MSRTRCCASPTSNWTSIAAGPRAAGVALALQPRELRLLEYLMRNAGRVVTRTMLLEKVWGFHFEPKTSVVETHVSRLRAKVDRPFEKPLIATVRGSGYMIGERD